MYKLDVCDVICTMCMLYVCNKQPRDLPNDIYNQCLCDKTVCSLLQKNVITCNTEYKHTDAEMFTCAVDNFLLFQFWPNKANTCTNCRDVTYVTCISNQLLLNIFNFFHFQDHFTMLNCKFFVYDYHTVIPLEETMLHDIMNSNVVWRPY